ncbi:hypothetical protein BU15DRAFT_66369 [Melanogaster broomeanus]|nr:hypothetical protein BU15DRAFT_66369 [Melanogaster broomeanus]
MEDPQHSSAKRQQHAQTFTSHITHTSLECQLLSTQAPKTELENKLREKDVYIKTLKRDQQFLAEREQAEWEEKEKEWDAGAEEKRKAEADLGMSLFELEVVVMQHRVTSGVRLVEFLSQDLDCGVMFLCGRPVFCKLLLVDLMLTSLHLMTPSRPS